MKTIEFLPFEYRHKQVLKRAKVWWVTIGVLFGTGIALAAMTQWGLRLQLHRQLVQFDAEYQIAVSRKAALEFTEKQLWEAEREAGLYVYLRHPWPTSQLLAALIKPLPATIQLTEVHSIQEEAHLAVGSNATVVVAAEATAAPADVNPFETDLTKLRTITEQKHLVFHLQGAAQNIEELHHYVDQLAKQRLFVNVELQSVSSGIDKSGAAVSQFQIRVRVRPGYGQKGGPTLVPSDAVNSEAATNDVVIVSPSSLQEGA